MKRAAIAAAMAAASLAAPAHADDYKIGVLNVDRVLQQSRDAKAAHDRIEQAFKDRAADVASREQEVRAAAAQLEKDGPTLSADERANRERALDARTRDVQRMREQLTEDLRTRQFEELDKLKQHLDAVLTRYAKERGYDLILQDAAFIGHAVDITDEVIKALDTQ